MSIISADVVKEFAAKADRPIAVVCDLGLSGLGVVIGLGRMGIPVIGVSHNLRSEGAFSKYCWSLLSPNAETQEQEYVEFLRAIGRLLKDKAVLIPTGDATAMLVSKMKKALEPFFHVPISDYETVKVLGDKNSFREALERLDMPHPRTYFPAQAEDIAHIADIVDYPCLVKPVQSSRFSEEFRTKAFVANDFKQLTEACRIARAGSHDVIVQEFIPGPDENLHLVHGYFDKDSKPLGVFTLRRVRQYPRGLGNGSMCIAKWLPELALQVESFVHAIGYQGIIDAELKLDPRDGRFKFIEINPRPGWQNRLATRCGINVPYLAYLDAIGIPRGGSAPVADGTKWLFMHVDMKSAFSAMRSGDLGLGDYLRSLTGPTECAIFAWDDPSPFFFALGQSAWAGIRKACRFITGHRRR